MREKNSISTHIIFAGILIVFFLNLFVIGTARTSGNSMAPTIPDGTLLVIRKTWFDINRDDVVTAYADGMPIVKRVVGLPGETVEISREGNIYIDGSLYENRFQNAYYPGASYVNTPITLDEDEFFLLGDNRFNSKDSRFFGPVKRKQVFGKVIHAFIDGKAEQKAKELMSAETIPVEHETERYGR